MTLSRRDLFKALFSRDARKGLSISRMGGTLEPGGFVTEIRGLRSSRANADAICAAPRHRAGQQPQRAQRPGDRIRTAWRSVT